MANKRIIFGIGVLCLLAGAIGAFLIEKTPPAGEHINVQNTKQPSHKKNNTVSQKQEDISIVTKKGDLYSNTPYEIPLVSIAEITKLKPDIKLKVDEIIDFSQGIYFLKHNNKTNETIILLQNAAADGQYLRHNLQMAKITNDGDIKYTEIGYSGQDDETESTQKKDYWEYDTSVEPHRPTKHINYDKHKKVLFTETWNYNDTEPIKYEMKDGKDRVVSIMKETTTGDTGYRREHIFYDEEGNITKSMSAGYEGANIQWFNYFDSKLPDEDITIESIYTDGLKTGEKVYNKESKLTNTFKVQYSDGYRTKLTISDPEGKDLEVIENQ